VLVPVQTSGKKPPLFIIHGLHGVMTLGPVLAAALGPEQPLYAIHADGVDGQRPAIDNVPDLVRAHVAEIHRARPLGPVVIAGMCGGTLIAMAIARDLQEKGREIRPIILLDPPAIPFGTMQQYQKLDPRQPQIARQLYEGVRHMLLWHASVSYNDMPFDANDADQLHAATLAGVTSLITIFRYAPPPYFGPAQVIVSAERAAPFFHRQMPWSKLLPGPRFVHVVPWGHNELFRSGREHVAQLLKFMLERSTALESIDERQMAPIPNDVPTPDPNLAELMLRDA
jgi:thioesterase domain-containing protein